MLEPMEPVEPLQLVRFALNPRLSEPPPSPDPATIARRAAELMAEAEPKRSNPTWHAAAARTVPVWRGYHGHKPLQSLPLAAEAIN